MVNIIHCEFSSGVFQLICAKFHCGKLRHRWRHGSFFGDDGCVEKLQERWVGYEGRDDGEGRKGGRDGGFFQMVLNIG
ncbi:unnamed protein product [Prunus armeniaca]|uniref:Uncharacterized protein n=1 Tax=Prunus armeniaca TaxID=36596 RepID=A0A6J5XLM9_PRUAR|nr:unnamed protein product [Prunus armeniaca]